MGLSVPKIVIFWLILCVILVSTGEVDITPDILSRYVTLEETENGTWLEVDQEYIGNISPVNTEVSTTIVSGDEIGFIQVLGYVWDAVKSIGYFMVAPVIYLKVLGMPWELQIIIGLSLIVALIWAVAGFIRGSDA